MADGHEENETFGQRFRQLLDVALRHPPEETTTREQLAATRDKLVRCMEAGMSRRFLHARFVKAGGVVSYQRFCVLVNDLADDEERVSTIRRKHGKAGRDKGGSKLLEARRGERGIGKTLEEIQNESAQALARVAGFEQEN